MKSRILLYALLALTISFVFLACNRAPQERQVELLVDSTTFYNNPVSDTAAVLENTSADSRMTTVPKSSPTAKQKTQKPAYTPTNNTTSQGAAQSNQGNEKKGWSKAAQGAVIGGASGAVGGAIISKNKGAGAAIGAAVGAAGGYIIGREKDKKDGRVKKNQKDKKQ